MIRILLFGFGLALAGGSLAADTNSVAAAATNGTFNVRDYGATGDGSTKDTAAMQKALDACAQAGGGTVTVPAGVYLTGSLVLGANTTLRLDGKANLMGSPDLADYPQVRGRWEGELAEAHRALLFAEKAGHVSITGHGSIFGPPISLSRLRNPRGPVLIEFNECTNVLLDGFSTEYQQLWSIHPLLCRDFTARNLVIRSINFNGDGIDVDSCVNVLIDHCNIDTGDDAVALKSGRGLAAAQSGRATENVVITNSVLVSSIYAGLALGTEMSGGIRNVRVENCVIGGRQNAIFIKSRDGRGGFMEDITGENLTINSSGTFLGINLVDKGIQASDPVPGAVEKWARVRNIRFEHVRVDNVARLVAGADVPAERPLDGLTLTDITGTCRKGIALGNMTNVIVTGVSVNGYEGLLFTKKNVQGSGLDNPPAAAGE
jgi:polygalacturonase